AREQAVELCLLTGVEGFHRQVMRGR
ncbi:MAG: hypothetical protein QOD91_2497, partial [Frankiales bacterium]|nr:hypothetical protein [Frankiales bacterium]